MREKIRTILYRNNKEEATDQILTLISEEIEKVDTPEFYNDFGGESGRDGFEFCRKKILALLK